MDLRITGLNRSMSINNKQLRNPFAQKNIRIASAKMPGISETRPRTSGVLANMKAMDEIESHKKIPGKKIRLMRGVVINAYKETPDTWTLLIFVGDNDKDYLAGQFISISPHQFLELKDFVSHFEYHKGKKELVRAYSLTSAPHEKYLAITIKPESFEPGPGVFPPLLSPLLASDLLVGREIEFTGFAGAYILTDEHRTDSDRALHLVAGSGAVPSFSIIKDELTSKNSHIKHDLIVVNKTCQDIIFHRELNELSFKYPDRMKVHYFLTQDTPHSHLGNNYYKGRPSIEFVERLIVDKHRTVFFACGPAITKYQRKQALMRNEEPKPRFMEWVHDLMERFEVDKKRFKREIYG